MPTPSTATSRRKKPADEKLDRYIMIRMTVAERDELAEFAKTEGFSFPAVWARTVLLATARRKKR